MEIKRYNRHRSGLFHEAVVYNGTLYLAGKAVPGASTVTEQAKATLAELETALEKYGSDKRHLISAMVYLADMSTFNEFNAVWTAWLEDGTQPVRACVEAKLAGPEYKVEVCVVAAVI